MASAPPTEQHAVTPSEQHAAGAEQSPADQAWAILRGLFFAERRRLFAAAAEVDLHPSQVIALLQMEPGAGMPMHELASVLGCDNSNVTGLADRLEARGLVARRPHAHDRRVRHIVLTEAGAQLRDRARALVSQAPEAVRRLSLEDQRLLLDVLQRVQPTG